MIPGSSVSGFFRTRDSQYQIERSLRFNRPDSAYLERTTTATGTDNRIGTWSFWIRRTELGVRSFVIGDTTNNSSSTYFEFGPDDTINVYDNNTPMNFATTQVFRDPTAWMHIVMYFDTTQATSTNRFRLYVNGTQVTAFSAATYPSQNATLNWGISGVTVRTGRSALSIYSAYYLAEFYYIDGQALTPSSFGETNATTGAWDPTTYSGSFGNAGGYWNFSDNSDTTATTLGKDSSGNGNNWTPNNFSVIAGAGNDSLTDTPTGYGTATDVGGVMRGNYATWSSIWKSVSTSTFSLANGNLDFTGTSGGSTSNVAATAQINVGEKVVFEVTMAGGSSFNNGAYSLGIIPTNMYFPSNPHVGGDTGIGYRGNGNKLVNGTETAYGGTWASGDVIRVEVDNLNGTIVFYKNNTSQGSISFTPFACLPAISGFNNNLQVANFGQRAFANTPTSGFLSLCTQNIATPAIALQNPRKGFTPTLYTGTGATLSTTGLSFGPDFVWIKSRSAATDHSLYDTSRGTQARLESNTTDAEATSDNGLTAFGSAGFTLGTLAQVNTSSATYVAWCWEEGATYGFDIVLYTGTGSATTFAHSLGAVPKFMIVKRRNSTSQWPVYHASLTSAAVALALESTSGEFGATSYWNSTAPSSSVFTVGTNADTNASGGTYVNYLWAPVAGFSFFGSYTGNGSADGPVLATGMSPAYWLTKRSSSTSDWMIQDSGRSTYNQVTGDTIYADLGNAEDDSSGMALDWLASGLKLRSSTTGNVSGTWIFASFASQNFKNARAR